jgi:hypothetical protein
MQGVRHAVHAPLCLSTLHVLLRKPLNPKLPVSTFNPSIHQTATLRLVARIWIEVFRRKSFINWKYFYPFISIGIREVVDR